MGPLPRMSEVGRHLDKRGSLLIHVQCGTVLLAPVRPGVLISSSGVGTVMNAAVGVLYNILHPQVAGMIRPLGPEVSRLFCSWVLCRLHGHNTSRGGASLWLPDSDSCLCYCTGRSSWPVEGPAKAGHKLPATCTMFCNCLLVTATSNMLCDCPLETLHSACCRT